MPELTIKEQLEQKAVDTLRMLAADAVQKADSGHPGMPMGAADYAFVLWTKYLRFNPQDPLWPNRDRFVLSAGHGSMLLYSLLHLAGFDLPLEELKNFRQWESKTPGHPEYWCAPGVETTTGPLGQGFGNGVGMAIAAKMMAERFNTDQFKLIDHYIYGIVSDGDLMEGVASEAASLAGHLGLSNIICLYDDNSITIEGKTKLAFSESVEQRFQAYHWHVIRVDGHDRAAIAQAIQEAQQETTRPKLIICRTHIGKGSPAKQDTASAHGEPLGEEEVVATKQNIGWPLEPAFLIPDDVRELFQRRSQELMVQYAQWQKKLEDYREQEPERAALWDAMWNKQVPEDIEQELLDAAADEEIATREASGKSMQVAAELVPSLVGGSADLAPSTKTLLKEFDDIAAGAFSGRNFHFGVREHAMGAIVSGLALYGSFIPFGATFLVFSDYMRPPIRLAAMMGIQVVYVFTHDSIFVGEDGPTHQPIEQMAALRCIPNLTVIRPADVSETAAAWAFALQHRSGPSALMLTRQKVPPSDRKKFASATNLKLGGYVLSDCEGVPDIVLIATGSEVHVALEAKEILQGKGKAVRVVSMPSMELFDQQSQEYRSQVLPPECKARVAIEAGCPFGWHKYVGPEGLILGIEGFGASAPYKVLAEKFGFTPEQVVERIEQEFGG